MTSIPKQTRTYRAVAIDWSILFVTYGPCRHIGPSVCYGVLSILLGAEACTVSWPL